jgi:adenosylmethionine-8-amino-7-oxononanoate aminotransferase
MQDVEKRKPFPVELGVGNRLVAACRDRGLISRAIADSYLLAPPLVTSPEQIDQIVEIVRDAVREVVPWARRQKPEL